MRVKLAAIHMEGRALQWHQSYVKNRNKEEEPPWQEYVEALKGRFGERVYEDPMADLKGLVQTGTLQEYLEEFDMLSHKVNLTEDYSLSCFISGLKDEIKIPVRMFGPKNLQQAYALARLQDSYISATEPQKTYSNRFQPTQTIPTSNLNTTTTKAFTLPSSKPPLLPTPNHSLRPNNSTTNLKFPQPINTKVASPFQTKRLIDEELNEKRAKNLCFGMMKNLFLGISARRNTIYGGCTRNF